MKCETEKYKNSLKVIKFYQYLILTSNMKSNKFNFYDSSRLLLSENYGGEMEKFSLSYLV